VTVRAGTGRGFVETLERLAGSQGSPVAAMLQLTARCNLACRHCYQVVRRTRELTTRRWVRVLGDLADAGVLFVTASPCR
jgi:MoaA/NifB/PqqE/SkfB family radical SAM enzyme